MKRFTCLQILGLLSLMFGSYQTSAQFTFLTDNRSAGGAVTTNGVLASGQTNFPSAPFASFNSTGGGNAGFSGGGTIFGSASQISSLASNTIIVTNLASLHYSFSTPPPGSINASSEYTYEVTFSVLTPTKINLAGFEANSSNPFAPVLPATLSSAHHGTIATAPGVPSFATTNWSFSGILQPDTYALTADENFFYSAQTGDGTGQWQTAVVITAVPSPQITATVVTNNTVQLTVSAAAGSTNRVLTSTNLENPISAWQPISTNVADGSGVFHSTNSIPSGQNTGFYLISSP